MRRGQFDADTLKLLAAILISLAIIGIAIYFWGDIRSYAMNLLGINPESVIETP